MFYHLIRKIHLRTKRSLLSVLGFGLIIGGFAQHSPLPLDSMIESFYNQNHQQAYWFASRQNLKKGAEWMSLLESSEQYGIVPDKTLTTTLLTSLSRHRDLDETEKNLADRQITGTILAFLKELQEGEVILAYDEVKVHRDSVYVKQLLDSRPSEHVADLVARLECSDPDYRILKKFLNDSISQADTLKQREVILAMNYRRYITANNYPEYVLVNIPETEARYYRNHLKILQMRVVAGKKKSPTPLIASFITGIVTFPNWNVPHSIAVKEILPKVQQDENYLEQNNFDIVDAKGNLVDDSDLKWKDFTEKNFPYYFRQSSGEDNSLGVLKFNLHNPFSIFLHSTSVPSSFARDSRFLSHGCIRLEKPFDLAIALMRGNIDIAELKSGKEGSESKKIALPAKIPVYLIYSPVVVDNDRVRFLPDVYGLLKQGR